jgi:hypothetical protein
VRLVDPDSFPEAARMFASPVFETVMPPEPSDRADPDFRFGLELILDGVATAIARVG